MDCNNCTCERRCNSVISIIDGDSIPYAYAWMFKDKDPCNSKDLEEARLAVQSGIYNTLKETKADYYIGMLAGGKCFRYECDPNYKGNRGSKTDSYALWGEVIKQILIDDHKFYRLDQSCILEVDDAVGICNTYFKKKHWSPIIVAVDKDILQLKANHYNPVKKTFITINDLGGITKTKKNKKNVVTAYGDYLIASQMITGDSTDNIKGIPKSGPMKAYDTLVNCETHYSMFRRIAELYKEYYTNEWQAFLKRETEKAIKLGKPWTEQEINDFIVLAKNKWKEEIRKTYTLIKILETKKEGKKYGFKIPKPIKVTDVNISTPINFDFSIAVTEDFSSLADLSI